MPTYEYHCTACERHMETFQSMRDDPLSTCPECGVEGKIVRKISGGAGIIFKGSGFYETDYKRSAESKEGTTTKEGGEKGGESKAESSGESKGGGGQGASKAAQGGEAAKSGGE